MENETNLFEFTPYELFNNSCHELNSISLTNRPIIGEHFFSMDTKCIYRIIDILHDDTIMKIVSVKLDLDHYLYSTSNFDPVGVHSV